MTPLYVRQAPTVNLGRWKPRPGSSGSGRDGDGDTPAKATPDPAPDPRLARARKAIDRLVRAMIALRAHEDDDSQEVFERYQEAFWRAESRAFRAIRAASPSGQATDPLGSRLHHAVVHESWVYIALEADARGERRESQVIRLRRDLLAGL